MSKRVSNKKSPKRPGVRVARTKVRLGWRKRLRKQLQEELRLRAIGVTS